MHMAPLTWRLPLGSRKPQEDQGIFRPPYGFPSSARTPRLSGRQLWRADVSWRYNVSPIHFEVPNTAHGITVLIAPLFFLVIILFQLTFSSHFICCRARPSLPEASLVSQQSFSHHQLCLLSNWALGKQTYKTLHHHQQQHTRTCTNTHTHRESLNEGRRRRR